MTCGKAQGTVAETESWSKQEGMGCPCTSGGLAEGGTQWLICVAVGQSP